MGLLDDAIRDHLELKRRRGADPAEVAREQQEALEPLADPVPASDLEASTEEHPLEAPRALDEEASASSATEQGHALSLTEDAQAAEVPLRAPESALRDQGDPLEETAELDMETVLDEPATAPRPSDPAAGAPPLRSGEVSAETPEVVDEISGQEHLRFEQGPPGTSGLDR